MRMFYSLKGLNLLSEQFWEYFDITEKSQLALICWVGKERENLHIKNIQDFVYQNIILEKSLSEKSTTPSLFD